MERFKETRKYILSSSKEHVEKLVDNGTFLKVETEDEKRKKLAAFSGKLAHANKIGKLIGEKAIEKKINKIVFDRGGYKYHGRIKALAQGARDAGLKF